MLVILKNGIDIQESLYHFVYNNKNFNNIFNKNALYKHLFVTSYLLYNEYE